MSLSFLPDEIFRAVSHLNYNYITEIRIRRGQPVIIGYLGEYYYLNPFGISKECRNALCVEDVGQIIGSATGGSIYSYAEQMKKGYITCGHGVRIGLAGEYVMQNEYVNTVANVTSLNIRIPHDVVGCSAEICQKLLKTEPRSLLIFSKPGMGKTTKLRDIVRHLSEKLKQNVLVFDERNEISAMDFNGEGYDLGDRVDVIRSGTKQIAFETAIRAMKPDVIITDELYGENDFAAVKYVVQCGIKVIASSHITDLKILKALPFEYYIELKSLFGNPIIYDKNFVACGGGGLDNLDRGVSVGGKKEEDGDIFRTV